MLGNFAFCLNQSNFPESTTQPPIELPLPERYLVVECTTMSAPHSNGRHSHGVASVLSTMSGTPAALATAAMGSRSITMPPGLARLSTKIARVLSLTAFLKEAGSSGSQKTAFQANFLKLCFIWLIEPP